MITSDDQPDFVVTPDTYICVRYDSFQYHTNEKSDTVMIAGNADGSDILKNDLRYPAPSICAASISTFGTCLKNCQNININIGAFIPIPRSAGSTNDQIVPRIPMLE